jgi:hypothetical protein
MVPLIVIFCFASTFALGWLCHGVAIQGRDYRNDTNG